MNGIGLGRIFGIEIRIDWSWVLILALVTWSLGSMFTAMHPGWTPEVRWGLAFLSAFLFFASVLAHELAHSVVAKARGIPVKNITLFVFGGVSNIQKEPDSPMSELLITIVGPLTSFILGFLFLVLGLGSAAIGTLPLTASNLLSQFGPAATMLIWLGSVNILLGVFNLIPGFPLDGGRVVRSILWAISGDLVRATRWASALGQTVAWMMILAGVLMLFGQQIPFLGGGIVNGIWMIFLGWFLHTAAEQNYHRIVLKDVLENVPVRRIMNPDVPFIPAETRIDDLIENHIMQTDHQAFLVIDKGRLVGLISIDDVRRVPPGSRRTTHARDIMTPSRNLVVVAPEENASEALDRLEDQEIRQLPVVQGNRIVGLVRRKDILRWLNFQSQSR